MKTLRTLLVLPLLAIAAPAHAGARDRLDAFTGDLEGLSADFEQKVYTPAGTLDETSRLVRGGMWLAE